MRPFVGWRVRAARPHRHGTRVTLVWLGCEASRPLGALGSRRRGYHVRSAGSGHEAGYLPPRRLMGMWLATEAAALDHRTLWKDLPRLDHQDYAHIRLAVLLATPKFAHLLEEGSPFLASSMSSIFAHVRAEPDQAPITSVVGIVDKLPSTATDLAAPTGAEGIAYLLAPAENHETEPLGHPQDDSSTSLLRFWLRPSQVLDQRKESRAKAYVEGQGNVSVPLANTLFINGRTTTLLETVWNRNEPDALAPGPSSPVGVLNIPLQRPVAKAVRSNIPLMEITPARPVRFAMGNILKQVDINDHESAPASKELEAEVMRSPFPSYPDGRRPRVFAQVKPPWLSPLACAPSTDALWVGVGLYHVTGGGGGWGQKQGLLSLDPVRAYSPTSADPSIIENMVSSDDSVEEVFRREGDLIKPGDTVQFFREITAHDGAQERASKSLERLGWGRKDGRQRMLVGVTAPPVDESRPATGSAVIEKSAATYVPDAFGLLSERGFAFEFAGKKVPEESKETHQKESERQEPETVHSQSKVEIPNSWLGVKVELLEWASLREALDNPRVVKVLGDSRVRGEAKTAQAQENHLERQRAHEKALKKDKRRVQRAQRIAQAQETPRRQTAPPVVEETEERQQPVQTGGRDIMINTKVPEAEPSFTPQPKREEKRRDRRTFRKIKVGSAFRAVWIESGARDAESDGKP